MKLPVPMFLKKEWMRDNYAAMQRLDTIDKVLLMKYHGLYSKKTVTRDLIHSVEKMWLEVKQEKEGKYED